MKSALKGQNGGKTDLKKLKRSKSVQMLNCAKANKILTPSSTFRSLGAPIPVPEMDIMALERLVEHVKEYKPLGHCYSKFCVFKSWYVFILLQLVRYIALLKINLNLVDLAI